MIRYYIQRIMKSRLYYVCMLISTVVLILGCFNHLLVADSYVSGEKISLMECLHTTLDFGGFFAVIAPALMSVSYLFFFTEDLEKKAIYYQLLRTNRNRFYGAQIIAALFTTTVLVVVSLIIFVVVCLSCGVVWEFNGQWFSFFDGSHIEQYCYGDNAWKMTIWYMILTVMYCLPWALVGMAVSLVLKNRYAIFVAPFVIFMLWNYVSQWIYQVQPKILWFEPMQPLLIWGILFEHDWSLQLQILYPVMYHVILIGGLSVLYLMVSNRRYRHEGI